MFAFPHLTEAALADNVQVVEQIFLDLDVVLDIDCIFDVLSAFFDVFAAAGIFGFLFLFLVG